MEWLNLWPNSIITHLTSPQSDHKALIVEVRSGMDAVHKNITFRYEIMCEREENLGSIVERAWLKRNPGSDLGTLAERLRSVTKDLREWSRDNFGQVTKQLEELRGEVDMLEREDPIQNWEAIIKAKKNLDELLYREEMMWLQRSRINWLREGDRNTKYFYLRARWRARKNRIKKLKKEDGKWMSDQQEMQRMAMDYFSNLFWRE